MPFSKLAFIDVETTGSSYRDRIIEIGILRVENGVLVSTFSSLVNPEVFLPDYIQMLTGIKVSMLEKAPTFNQIKADVAEMLDGCVFVAHNVRFDYGFIKNEFKRLEMPFSLPQLCTVRLSRALFPNFRKHNLDALIERFNFKVENRHRAFDDAKVLWEFYQEIRKTFPNEKLTQYENRISGKITTPLNLAQKVIDNLPESPGVYIFYDKNGAPLYVGKSINIKERVLSHFRSDVSDSKEQRISEQIYSIESIQTSGELGALLKESSLIKQLMPLHNRVLRRVQKLTFLRKVKKQNLETVELSIADQIASDELDSILGVFRSKKAAHEFLEDFAKKYSLCKQALGLQAGKGFCFDYHLEKCKGICGGKEKETLYNLRFAQAFASEKLKTWPFKSAIAIREEDPLSGEGESFIIDKWCFLGTIKFGKDYQEELKNDFTFDYDLYKILVRYLFTPKNRTNIVEIDSLIFNESENSLLLKPA